MTRCHCPACRNRNSKWTTTPSGWTDSTAPHPSLPQLPPHLLGQQCHAENNTVADGVFLWVETHSTGHAFISIHSQGKATVYTYGRYGDMPPGNPLIGEGILLRMIHAPAKDYLQRQLYQLRAQVFKIVDADQFLMEGYLSGVYMSSERATSSPNALANTRRYGRVVDQYDLTGNNCTTHSVKAIRFGGSRVFDRTIVGFSYSEDFTIPGSLLRYMRQVSADATDVRAVDVTGQMKTWFPNTGSFRAKEENLEDRAMGSAADALGYTGSSTGYAGGTVNGSLRGRYEPEEP